MRKDNYTRQSMGRHNGINYIRQRICDVMVLESRQFAWFPYNPDGTAQGSMFATLRELKEWADKQSPEDWQAEDEAAADCLDTDYGERWD
jgi:hypothetical protein